MVLYRGGVNGGRHFGSAPRANAGGETGVGLTVLARASTPSTCELVMERTYRRSEMIAVDCCR